MVSSLLCVGTGEAGVQERRRGRDGEGGWERWGRREQQIGEEEGVGWGEMVKENREKWDGGSERVEILTLSQLTTNSTTSRWNPSFC